MTTQNLGQEGFIWFLGKVDDRNDPEKQGRVRVRIYALHGDKVAMPTNTLPWATVLMPGNSASANQVGQSATGLAVGSTVVGFFFDGAEATMPIVFGVLPGKGDIPKLAAEQNTLNKTPLGPEPSSPYNAKYPFNKVFQSESGHVIEIDDTPNFERLHTYHRSGTYSEIDHDGTRVNKIVGDDFEIVQKNKTVYINGNVTVEVKGDYRLNVAGGVYINGSKINLNNGSQGAARVGDPVTGGVISEGSSTVTIGG